MNRSMPSSGTSPHLANLKRLDERALRRVAKLTLSTPGGRRRKKAILSAELPRYRELIRLVAVDLAAGARSKTRPRPHT
ncbi:hypothetical protein [Arthrobacter sp. zg-Y1110]|uniref:hypothetical protein n=1 Tax=Arthrobacter sp. zg-Y1110 TaxID=2886932 RepID=UPI001D14C9AC|nr:hypothetical protein [Arthrobacter sp. zg-Y1110]MCC3292870.1 hypothetical protein [Arthrobacter sp. zg-Y1110]UWX86808.1 hypothetical protein N2K99_18370 [Arthrobacter sp. zg-Y1110]